MDPIQVTEPLTYARDNFETSFFADLYKVYAKNDTAARKRLERGTRETLVEAESRGIKFKDAEGRAMSSSAGAGGDFLPPLYFGDLYAEFRRQTRVAAGLVWNRQLPPKGTTVTVPRVSAGGSNIAQTADNQNVSNVDETSALVTVPVSTVAGYLDLSRQILERAEPGFDEVVAYDLILAYGKSLDNYVLNGTGASGQPKGLLTVVGTNAITYTQASPTVGNAYPKLADGMRQVAENVFSPPTAWLMTARRWAWFVDALDAQNRPLVVPETIAQANDRRYDLGSQDRDGDSDLLSPVGTIMGLPVYVDENLPKTQGAGTNQDVIVVADFRKHILWEEPAGPRVFQFEDNPNNSSAEIRVQAFGLIAFTGERYPAATSVITGTGLVAPTF